MVVGVGEVEAAAEEAVEGALGDEGLQVGDPSTVVAGAVAEPVLSSITETRYCISDHLLWFGAPLVFVGSPLLRTPLPRSDTASRISFEDYLVRRL